jgi:hypothetical protein
MIKSSIEKLAEEIGFDIGTSDDVTQSNLLNGFCKGLANSMNGEKLGTQLCYISDKLSPKSELVIKELYEFILLKNK